MIDLPPMWTTATLAAAVCALPSGVFAAEPAVIETEAPYYASFGDQFDGDMVSGGGVHFAVWTDQRAGGVTGNGHDLYAQIINADGSLVFEGSLLLERGFDAIRGLPRVAWNGSSFMVVWGNSPDVGSNSVRAMRIAPDGTILDPEPIIIQTLNSALVPDVASDGDQFFVVYMATSPGFKQIYAKRVAADGTVVDETPLVIRPGGDNPAFLLQPRVEYAGNVYVVVWHEDDWAFGCRVVVGQVFDPGGVQLTPFPSFWPNIATDGSDFMITWTEADNAPATNLGGGVLDIATMTIPSPQNITDSAEIGSAWAGQAAFGGEGYLVLVNRPDPVFSFSSDLFAQRINLAGAPVGPLFPLSIRPASSENAIGVSFDGAGFYTMWEDYRDGGGFSGTSIYGARVTTQGFVLDLAGVAVSPGASWQLISGMAFDGQNYLLVWEDWRQGPDNGYSSDLYASRIAPDGTVLDDPAMFIAGDVMREQEPQVIFDGTQYMIVYEYGGFSTTEIRAVRVLPDGTVLDINGFTVAQPLPTGSLIRPQVAFDGENYLVVWHNDYGVAGEVGVVGMLVSPDGTIISPSPIPIATQSFVSSTDFSVESDGNEFLVTWTVPVGGGDVVRATRVSSAGQVVGTVTLYTAPFTVNHTRMAYNGSSYMVTWHQGLFGDGTLQAVRVGSTGHVLGPVMNLRTGIQGYVDVAAHDGTFVVPFLIQQGPDPLGFYITQLDADGSVLMADQLVQEVILDEIYSGASIADGPGGSMFFSTSRWADMPYNSPRVWGQKLDFGTTVLGDLDGDGQVGITDFLTLLSLWGPCPAPCPPSCPADLDDDCQVGIVDLLILLANWG